MSIINDIHVCIAKILESEGAVVPLTYQYF